MNFLALFTDSHLPPTNLPFLFAAFAVTWVVFFVYAFFVSRRRQEMQRDLAQLRLELEEPKNESQ